MKKIFILFLLSFLVLTIVGCDMKQKDINADDFELLLVVDKNKVCIGDKLIIKASVKNISNDRAVIRAGHTDNKNKEDLIHIGFFFEGMDKNYIVNSKGGPLKKMVVNKDETITKTITYYIDDSKSFVIKAFFSFYSNDEIVVISSDEISITVEL